MWWVAAFAAALLLVPASAPAQFSQQPTQDQYGQPPGSTPPPRSENPPGRSGEAPGREQSRDPDAGGGGRQGDGPRGGTGPDTASGGGVGGAVAGNELPLRDAEGGSLPFTGLDTTLMILLGLMLAGAGFAIRAAQRATAARRAGSG